MGFGLEVDRNETNDDFDSLRGTTAKKKRSESSFERNALVRNSSVERERSKKEKQRGNEFEKVRETNVNKPAQEERI